MNSLSSLAEIGEVSIQLEAVPKSNK